MNNKQIGIIAGTGVLFLILSFGGVAAFLNKDKVMEFLEDNNSSTNVPLEEPKPIQPKPIQPLTPKPIENNLSNSKPLENNLSTQNPLTQNVNTPTNNTPATINKSVNNMNSNNNTPTTINKSVNNMNSNNNTPATINKSVNNMNSNNNTPATINKSVNNMNSNNNTSATINKSVNNMNSNNNTPNIKPQQKIDEKKIENKPHLPLRTNLQPNNLVKEEKKEDKTKTESNLDKIKQVCKYKGNLSDEKVVRIECNGVEETMTLGDTFNENIKVRSFNSNSVTLRDLKTKEQIKLEKE